MDTRRVEEYIKRLKRRERFLIERIQEKEEDRSHYDRSELVALQWMIRYVEDTILVAAEHQTKWFNEETND